MKTMWEMAIRESVEEAVRRAEAKKATEGRSVEAAARTIAATIDGEQWDDLHEWQQDRYLAKAKLVLDAAREATA